MTRTQPWIQDEAALADEIQAVERARTAADEELPPRYERFSQLTREEYHARVLITEAAGRYTEALKTAAQLRQLQADYLEALTLYTSATETRPPAPQDDAFLNELGRSL